MEKYAVWGNGITGGVFHEAYPRVIQNGGFKLLANASEPSASPTEKRLESAGWMTYCSEHQTMN